LSALAVRSLTDVVDQSRRSLTGVNVLWLGASRY
jgi:protease-4